MNNFTKMKPLSLSKANADADMQLINRYALRELKPEEVFTYSVIICDNEVDRSYERFTADSLNAMSELFVGKTGISDHSWKTENQIARIYRCEVLELDGKTVLGDQKLGLRGDFYMLRDGNEKIIAAIEGGIIKEVSVAGSVTMRTCSICGAPFKDFSYDNWSYVCDNGHMPGKTDANGNLCVMELGGANDAYEVSFVAVPCQRGAGITKSLEDEESRFEAVMKSDWRSLGEEKIKALISKGQAALQSDEEQKKRAELIAEFSKMEF